MLVPRVGSRTPAHVVAVPTPGGVRSITILDRLAAAAYDAAVSEVARTIEERLGPAVFANRVAGAAPLALEPWRPARARFRRSAVRLADRASALVVTDVLECFASTSAQAVAEALARIGCEAHAVARIGALLRRFQDEGVRGLPVGPEPSAVLANAVLCAADDALEADGAEHLRWVDDFVIGAADAADAARRLERVRTVLASSGLSINGAKTRVIDEPSLARAMLLRRSVSDVRPVDRLRTDAHALSSLKGANLLPPSGRGLDPHRRTPRPARGRR